MARDGGGIRVKVRPRASRDQCMGFRGDVLQVRVTAPPERGKANHALVKLLAETLEVPESRIRVLKGHASRDKWVAIDGLSPDSVYHRLMGRQPE